MTSIIKADLIRLLESFECVPDEDSCMGKCFIEGRKYYSEDAFYSLLDAIKKEVTKD